MISKENFALSVLRPMVRKHVPIKAYWHSGGFGVIRPGDIPIGHNGQPLKHPMRGWDRQIERMRRQGLNGLSIIEYDGSEINETEGSDIAWWI